MKKIILVYILAYAAILTIGATLEYKEIIDLYSNYGFLEVAKVILLNKGNLFALLLLFGLMGAEILYSMLSTRTSKTVSKAIYLVAVVVFMFASTNIVWGIGV